MAVDIPNLVQVLAVQIQNLRGCLYQLVAGIGQGEFRRACKQLDIQFPLHVADMVGERLLGDIQHFRCDNLLLLQNYDRMYQVGRGFGDIMVDGKLKHLFIPLAAFGSPVELPEEFLRAENPFTV